MKKINYYWENRGLRSYDDGEIDFLRLTLTNKKMVVEFGDKRLIIKRIIQLENQSIDLTILFGHIPFPKENTNLENTMCDGYNEHIVVDSVKIQNVSLEDNIIVPFHIGVNKLAGFNVVETCMKNFNEYFKII